MVTSGVAGRWRAPRRRRAPPRLPGLARDRRAHRGVREVEPRGGQRRRVGAHRGGQRLRRPRACCSSSPSEITCWAASVSARSQVEPRGLRPGRGRAPAPPPRARPPPRRGAGRSGTAPGPARTSSPSRNATRVTRPPTWAVTSADCDRLDRPGGLDLVGHGAPLGRGDGDRCGRRASDGGTRAAGDGQAHGERGGEPTDGAGPHRGADDTRRSGAEPSRAGQEGVPGSCPTCGGPRRWRRSSRPAPVPARRW